MDRIWSTITNPDALMINDAWAGHPGTLVKSYPATNAGAALMIDQAACGGGGGGGGTPTTGWKLEGGKLIAPGQAAQCLDGTSKGGPTGQSTSGMVSCPPPTTNCNGKAGGSCPGCGMLFANCSAAVGEWTLKAVNFTNDGVHQVLQWAPTLVRSSSSSSGSSEAAVVPPAAKPKCLSARPSSLVGGFYGGPKAALTTLGNCPGGGKIASTSTFTLSTAGELKVGSGMCLTAHALYGAQLWHKPLPGGKVAVLIVNLAPETQDFSLPLADVPSLNCGAGKCTVRDVWLQKDMAPEKDHVPMTLREHESGFYILGVAT
jgi:hypothetical protein